MRRFEPLFVALFVVVVVSGIAAAVQTTVDMHIRNLVITGSCTGCASLTIPGPPHINDVLLGTLPPTGYGFTTVNGDITPDPTVLGKFTIQKANGLFPGTINATNYGVVGDGRRNFSGAMGAASTTLTLATVDATHLGFAPTDCNVTHGGGCTGSIDKMIAVSSAGAGGANLITTIVGYTAPNQVTLAAASTSGTSGTCDNASGGACVNWGTDNLTALASAYTAASSSLLASGPVGGNGSLLFLPAGRILTSGNLVFNQPFVSVLGSGKGETILASGGTGGGGVACTKGVNGTIQWLSTSSEWGSMKLQDLDNTADCFVNVSATSSTAISINIHDMVVVSDNTTAHTTDPIGFEIGGLTNSSISNLQVGGSIFTTWVSYGFRQQIKDNSFMNGVRFSNITVQPASRDFAASVFNDGTAAAFQMGGQGVSILHPIVEFGINGINLEQSATTSTGITGGWFGDLPGSSAPEGVYWMPSATYTNGASFVAPVTLTTVNTGGGTCNSGTNTCTVTSSAGLWEKETIRIAGSGTAGVSATWGITACGAVGNGSGACTSNTLTLSGNLISSPANGSAVAAIAYTGMVFRAAFQDSAGTCVSAAAQPAWPATAGLTVVDGTCTWAAYGPGASIYDTAGAVNNSAIQGPNLISGTPIGVLHKNNLGAMAISGNMFFTNTIGAIVAISGSSISVTGNTFNSPPSQPNVLSADSGSSNISWFSNVTASSPSCALNFNSTTASFVFGPSSICGTSTTGVTQFDTTGKNLNTFLKLNLINTAAASVPATFTGASAQSADLTDWKNNAGTILAFIDNAGDISGASLTIPNNGHVFLLKGTGVAPTAGTGSVTASSSDASFEVTGATTFPLTITLNVACPNAVFPVCVDETTAVVFKVTHPTAQTVVLTGNTNGDSILCNTVCK